MARPVKTRRYDASRRRAAAEKTKAAILQAARELFTSRGYAGTGVVDIARRAGVSVDTVYTAVGRKPQVLLAVYDMQLAGGDVPLPAEERGYVRRIRAETTGRAKIDAYCDALAHVLPATAPLLRSLKEAAGTDPDCAAMYQLITERRAANMRLFIADLRATGEMRDDLADDDAAALVWSMNAGEYYELLSARGYGPDEYAAMLRDVWSHTLLRAGDVPRSQGAGR